MNNIRTFLLIGILYVAFFNSLQAQDKPLVVSTASIFADMAQNIAGELADVRTVVPIGGDPHIYEPTPGDAHMIAQADLILRNGLTFEGWLNEIIENSGTKAENVLITEGIASIESATYANSADPHAWMDAAHGLVYIKNIKDALIRLLPQEADAINFNYGVYKQQLEDMDAYIFAEIKKIPKQRRVLITSHDAFQYYGRRYGLQLESVLGTSTDAQVQTNDIIRLNKVLAETGVPSVFVESTINPKLLQQLAKDNNVTVGGQLYSDSIGDKDSPAPTYLDMLRHNTNTIVGALTKEKEATNIDTSSEKNSDENDNNWWLWLVVGLLLVGSFVVVIRKMG